MRYFLLGVVLLCVWGCQTMQNSASSIPHSTLATESSEVQYSLIYVIHGDANYLYHDEKGQGLQADEQQLQEAIAVARQAKQGEVFIFHLRPEEQFLWLFPKKDRLFLHYRNGERITRKKYSPLPDQGNFEKEIELYHQFRSTTPSRKVFLYYGHEIPAQKYTGYFESRPQISFDIQQFVQGMGSFLGREETFDLTVLSTCDNGTPRAVSALRGKTEFLVASPENLHLSHIDSDRLLQLEQPDKSVAEVGRSIAEATYERLADFLQTVVTIAVYDMNRAQAAAERLSGEYKEYHSGKEDLLIEQENIDCSALPFWNDQSGYANRAGVEIFFKSPAFGPKAHRETHSGWGCQP